MLGFKLSEEQQMLRELARDFAMENVRPKAEKWDLESQFPLDAIKEAHSLGLTNLHIPEKYGGPGMGVLEEAIVGEEMSWGDPGFGTAQYSNGLTAAPIITGGTEYQKEKYLRMLAEKPLIASYCVTEPGAGSDVSAIKTTAVLEGDYYILNGSKMWITGAGQAEWFFVLAYTDQTKGYKGMSAFIVESGWDGVELGKKETNMGQRASDTRGVTFTDVSVPKENLVGGVEGMGWMNAMKAFDYSRPVVAAQAVGISRAAYEHALHYSNERQSFGKKLHEHQSIQFILADMKTKIEASRLLCWKSAWEADNGIRNTESAAHAKRFSADACMEITTDAVQVFGGYGYSEEYPVARLMRGAKVLQIYEGSSQVQRMIIGREMLKGL
tara:strand:- start:3513 stop:4661 length:1149 start_codon:yes stop_codon:yes gene_type:complete